MHLSALFYLGLVATAAEPTALSGRAMGTTWSVKFVQPVTPLRSAEVERRIAERLEQLEQIFSTYRSGSEISRFNATGGTGWEAVSAELAHAATEARQISELSGGAYDVTVDPLVRLWGFGPEGKRATLTTPQEVAAARLRVDWRQLQARREPPALRRARAGVTADFSSIAKGFAVDALSTLLVALGAKDHLVQIGGDLKTAGRPAESERWRSGIEEPTPGPRSIALVVRLEGEALSSSGDYRNYIDEGGRRFGHIINPLTGRPAGSNLAAVSVVHRSCAFSSAMATALYVLGSEEGYDLAVRERLACLFFVREEKGKGLTRRPTPEFERLVENRDLSKKN